MARAVGRATGGGQAIPESGQVDATGDASEREKRFLVVSAIGNLGIGSAGVGVSVLASSQAVLLDGLFNLTYFVTALLALRVSRLLARGDDQVFPMGYAYFEPLINGAKGILVLGITAMALFGAVQALAAGGRSIVAGPAIVYAVFAAAGSIGLGLALRRGAHQTESPLLWVDAENWLVAGAISAAVLVAFVGIAFAPGTSFAPLVPYADPVLVLVVCIVSIGVPIRMSRRALMELLNRAPDPEIVRGVREVVERCTQDLPVQELFVRVIQPGRTRFVVAHVVLPADFETGGLPALDAVQDRTLTALMQEHPDTIADLVFTADPMRGVPGPPRWPDPGAR